MRWFNNLNAKPRLIVSFGVLMVLTLGISALSIYNLGQANTRIGLLYQDDMAGLRQANQIAHDRLSLWGDSRDAIIHMQDGAFTANEQQNMLNNFADLHLTLDQAEKNFNSAEERELIDSMHSYLPPWESAYHDMYSRIQAKDLDGTMAAMTKASVLGKKFQLADDRAIAVKAQRGEEKYLASGVEYQTTRMVLVAFSALSLGLGILLSITIANGFSRPLKQAVDALERIAGGDLTVTLDVPTQDEVGHLAAALNATVQKLGDTMSDVANSAAHANSSSQQLAAAAEAIASGSQEQAASLEETSASLEEIIAAVRQSADNATQASQLAIGSKESAQLGQQVVSDAINAMTEINAASSKISEIISTIDEIAFQTNLLAVNAAVEAARAGEEGRGFAVVASEVRSLAQRSSLAAKEIKGLIQDSLRKVDAGSTLVNRSGETLQGIVGSVKRVTDIVGEIAAAAGEQSTGIQQVGAAMTQMDRVTQSNSAQTEELSATAQVLSEQAAHLSELVNTFVLSGDGRGAQDRQSLRSREASAPRPVGANLVYPAI